MRARLEPLEISAYHHGGKQIRDCPRAERPPTECQDYAQHDDLAGKSGGCHPFLTNDRHRLLCENNVDVSCNMSYRREYLHDVRMCDFFRRSWRRCAGSRATTLTIMILSEYDTSELRFAIWYNFHF